MNTQTTGLGEAAGLQTLAARTQGRAARAHWHAALALEQARRDAAAGDHYAQRLHLREAEIHRQAARLTEQTAALYRERVRRLLRAERRLDGAGRPRSA